MHTETGTDRHMHTHPYPGHVDTDIHIHRAYTDRHIHTQSDTDRHIATIEGFLSVHVFNAIPLKVITYNRPDRYSRQSNTICHAAEESNVRSKHLKFIVDNI